MVVTNKHRSTILIQKACVAFVSLNICIKNILLWLIFINQHSLRSSNQETAKVCVETATSNCAGFFSVCYLHLDLVPCGKVKDSWQCPVMPEVDVAIQKYVIYLYAVLYNMDGQLWR